LNHFVIFVSIDAKNDVFGHQINASDGNARGEEWFVGKFFRGLRFFGSQAEEEAIVEKKAKDIFDQVPTAEEGKRIDEAYDTAESVDIPFFFFFSFFDILFDFTLFFNFIFIIFIKFSHDG